MKKTVLRNYAKLIAQKGVNIQKGQDVVDSADLDQPEFVKMVVEECYRQGAKKVTVEWAYQPLTKVNYRYRTLTTLSKIEDWEIARLKHYVDTLPCYIYLESEDPDGLKGVNMEKLAKARQKKYPIQKPYLDAMENKYQWCIAAVPGAAWAKKMFPDLPKGKAIEKLWEAILYTSRVTDDPIAAWNEHNADLKSRCEYLNGLGIKTLVYHSKNGTDLRVGMIPQAEFKGGADRTVGGTYFNPNIPSEECFISPMRGEAEGIVYATKPLSYQGQLIEDFSVRFEGGKVVEVHAGKNEELLKKMVSMDEGASYLGECALVPYDSPISNSNLLFYSTLFDENAACHLALGAGFADTIKDFDKYTLDECREMGINDSMIHVDFMIGCDDLQIDAETNDGKTVPVFRNGNWAF